MLTILFIGICVGAVHGFAENAHLCDLIQNVDCSTQYPSGVDTEVVCASDDVTYQNYCEYSKARCKTPTTHIFYVGPCVFTTTQKAPQTTVTTKPIVTTQPAVVTSTLDTLQSVFCASKGSINCPTDLDPICGSDGNFYLNKCEFSKQACEDKTLLAKPQDQCIGG